MNLYSHLNPLAPRKRQMSFGASTAKKEPVTIRKAEEEEDATVTIKIEKKETREELAQLISSAYAMPKMNEYQTIENKKAVITNELKCGEDAFFIEKRWIGVADGVGGWTSAGVDPSVISSTLMKETREAALANTTNNSQTCRDVLIKGYENMVTSGAVKAGSTTACILHLSYQHEQLVLSAANLGDSGFIVLRRNPSQDNDFTVFYKSNPQQHAFNCPFQLAIVPPSYRVTGYIEDKPQKAQSIQVNVQKGDLIVASTDGLFDNLFDDAVCRVVNHVYKKDHDCAQEKLNEIAKMLCFLSKMKAYGRDPTPFSTEYNAHHPQNQIAHQGKPDDITVICSFVDDSPENKSESE